VGSGIQFALENAGAFNANPTGGNKPLTMPGPSTLELLLYGDPAAGTLTAYYRVDSTSVETLVRIGTLTTADHPSIANFFAANAKAGVLATNAGSISSASRAMTRRSAPSICRSRFASVFPTSPVGHPARVRCRRHPHRTRP
jgi:hypothetical protein